ncbi:MAG: hypothetical protein WAO83_02870 [Fuerstiella sp.]
MSSIDRQWDISEADAKKLKKQVVVFRQQWAAFANRSHECFENFRSKGATLTDDFYDELCEMEQRKDELHRRLSEATSQIPGEQWELPESSASLHDFEESLIKLKDLCKAHEQHQRERVGRVLAPLEPLANIQTDSEDIRSCVHELTSRIEKLSDSVLEFDREAIDAAESLYAANIALLKLINEGTSGDQQQPETMTNAEFNECFELIDGEFGRHLAIATIRGQLKLGRSSDHAQTLFKKAEQQGISEPSPEMLSLLQKHFNEPRDKLTAPRTLRRVQPIRKVTISALEAEGVLRSAIDGLQKHLSELKSRDSVGANQPGHPTQLQTVGYSNLIQITEHLILVLNARDTSGKTYRSELEVAANLLAEAHSAVRVGAGRKFANEGAIPELVEIFNWLKTFVSPEMESIHVKRHMRLEDQANPINNDNVANRIHGVVDNWTKTHAAAKQLMMIEKSVKELQQTGLPVAISTIDLWVQQYLKGSATPSDAMLRELLSPVYELLPDPDETPADLQCELSEDFKKVLRNLDAHLQMLAERELEAEASKEVVHIGPELERVRQWFCGKRIALVAGVPDQIHKKRIEDAFQLKELKWVEASKTDRASELSSQVGEVDLLILITKLIGHKHNTLRGFCSEIGVPSVQTKKNQGFGVNTLVEVITQQASRQLDRVS